MLHSLIKWYEKYRKQARRIIMTEQQTYIPWDLAEHFIYDGFVHLGVPKDDAIICTDVILESDRRGIESHGCNRFKSMYIDRIDQGLQKPVTRLEICKETPTTLVVDAHQGLGMVASYRIMQRLIEKSKHDGLAMGVIKNSSHYGIAGYWSTMASKEGMLGISGTNTRPMQAPTFGVSPVLGTNPLAFAFPTDESFPFLFDGATCVHSRGKIECYERMHSLTPKGVAIGIDGHFLQNSHDILQKFKTKEAAMLPVGGAGEDLAGYKGYGLATVVEILCAALSGGDYLSQLSGYDAKGHRVHHNVGHFFLVINPDFFLGEHLFTHISGNILREIRSSPKAPGQERIFTAGEKAYETWIDRKNKGIPLLPRVQQEFISLRDRFHLSYIFPFEN